MGGTGKEEQLYIKRCFAPIMAINWPFVARFWCLDASKQFCNDDANVVGQNPSLTPSLRRNAMPDCANSCRSPCLLPGSLQVGRVDAGRQNRYVAGFDEPAFRP
jgi:hypothetical protein